MSLGAAELIPEKSSHTTPHARFSNQLDKGIIDYFWNSSQDNAIEELKAAHDKIARKDTALMRQLQDENQELRVRVGVLIRLLIERGVFSADEFATSVKNTKANLEPGQSAKAPHYNDWLSLPRQG